MSPQMHMSCVQPDKERFSSLVLTFDEITGGCYEFVITRFHALLGERTSILNLLLSYSSPARMLRRIVLVCCPAMQHSARSKFFVELWKIFLRRPIRQFRLFFGVEVI